MKTTVRLSDVHLIARAKSLRNAMVDQKVDAMLLTHAADIAWLTGFTGHDSVAVVTGKAVVLVTDFRYQEQAQREAPWMKAVIRKGKMSDALAAVLVSAKAASVGFEGSHTTVATVDALKAALKAAKSAARLKSLSSVLFGLRKTKDDAELAIIQQSIAVAQDAYKTIIAKLKPGITENLVAAELVLEMRRRGASGSSFDCIIGAGANSSLPHYRPGEVVVKNNEPVLFDWGAIFQGYCSDLTRVVFLGKVNPKMKEIYQVVLDAQLAAIDAIKPGLGTHDAHNVAAKVIKKAGYEKYFGHGLGHGIGRDIHELPSMNPKGANEPLLPGHVVTVEPGIYLPGIGGVRIEDDVLVTATGNKVLSSLDKSFEGACLG